MPAYLSKGYVAFACCSHTVASSLPMKETHASESMQRKFSSSISSSSSKQSPETEPRSSTSVSSQGKKPIVVLPNMNTLLNSKSSTSSSPSNASRLFLSSVDDKILVEFIIPHDWRVIQCHAKYWIKFSSPESPGVKDFDSGMLDVEFSPVGLFSLSPKSTERYARICLRAGLPPHVVSHWPPTPDLLNKWHIKAQLFTALGSTSRALPTCESYSPTALISPHLCWLRSPRFIFDDSVDVKELRVPQGLEWRLKLSRQETNLMDEPFLFSDPLIDDDEVLPAPTRLSPAAISSLLKKKRSWKKLGMHSVSPYPSAKRRRYENSQKKMISGETIHDNQDLISSQSPLSDIGSGTFQRESKSPTSPSTKIEALMKDSDDEDDEGDNSEDAGEEDEDEEENDVNVTRYSPSNKVQDSSGLSRYAPSDSSLSNKAAGSQKSQQQTKSEAEAKYLAKYLSSNVLSQTWKGWTIFGALNFSSAPDTTAFNLFRLRKDQLGFIICPFLGCSNPLQPPHFSIFLHFEKHSEEKCPLIFSILFPMRELLPVSTPASSSSTTASSTISDQNSLLSPSPLPSIMSPSQSSSSFSSSLLAEKNPTQGDPADLKNSRFILMPGKSRGKRLLEIVKSQNAELETLIKNVKDEFSASEKKRPLIKCPISDCPYEFDPTSPLEFLRFHLVAAHTQPQSRVQEWCAPNAFDGWSFLSSFPHRFDGRGLRICNHPGCDGKKAKTGKPCHHINPHLVNPKRKALTKTSASLNLSEEERPPSPSRRGLVESWLNVDLDLLERKHLLQEPGSVLLCPISGCPRRITTNLSNMRAHIRSHTRCHRSNSSLN